LAALALAAHAGFVAAYTSSLDTVFLVAVPIAGAAFLLALTLREVPMREVVGSPDPAQSLAPTAQPSVRGSADGVLRALSVLARREDRAGIYRSLAAAADLDLDPRSVFVLLRLDGHRELDLSALAASTGTDTQAFRPLLHPLVAAGLVEVAGASASGGAPGAGEALRGGGAPRAGRAPAAPGVAAGGGGGGGLGGPDQTGASGVVARITPAGAGAIERRVAARRAGLARLLGRWSAEVDARLAERLDEPARDVLRDPPRFRSLVATAP
jgi:DNA-binding MarR family transcriptional regulator